MDWRILAHHDSLRISLHGGGYRNYWLAIGDSFQDGIGRGHAELRCARSDLLRDADIGTTRLDRYIESLIPVITFDHRIIESPMFGLRVPIRLKSNRRQAGLLRRMAATERAQAGD